MGGNKVLTPGKAQSLRSVHCSCSRGVTERRQRKDRSLRSVLEKGRGRTGRSWDPRLSHRPNPGHRSTVWFSLPPLNLFSCILCLITATKLKIFIMAHTQTPAGTPARVTSAGEQMLPLVCMAAKVKNRRQGVAFSLEVRLGYLEQ